MMLSTIYHEHFAPTDGEQHGQETSRPGSATSSTRSRSSHWWQSPSSTSQPRAAGSFCKGVNPPSAPWRGVSVMNGAPARKIKSEPGN